MTADRYGGEDDDLVNQYLARALDGLPPEPLDPEDADHLRAAGGFDRVDPLVSYIGPGYPDGLVLFWLVDIAVDHLGDHPLVEEREFDRWEYVGPDA